MPTELDPKTFQHAAAAGYKRLQSFRDARLMFLSNYVGNYYDQSNGAVGTNVLNMIFNAIRVLVPNLVMQRPTHKIVGKYLQTRDYAELLEMALKELDTELGIDNIYRSVIVDAIFTLGILKTGIAPSDSVYAINEYDRVDTGTIYTQRVSFENLIVDPRSKEHLFADAAFLGDRICIPRQALLESGLYNNELIERLPAVGMENKKDKAEDLSRQRTYNDQDSFLAEEVEIAELWVPSLNALITIPGGKDVVFEDYLRITDYYGPSDGPYTFLALTPPVPDNPLPIPSVGIWNDLHILTNEMARKVTQQALDQRDVLLYRRQHADDADAIMNANDGDAIAVDDPSAAQTVSFGGQRQSNELFLATAMNWFNMMSANSEALAGQRSDADSATEARILANNASIGLEDQRGLVYAMAATEARKRAWYLHTDPFINIPLVKRVDVPAQFAPGEAGPTMTVAPASIEVQIYLTPEARNGDFLDFHFEIVPESMTKQDSQTQYRQCIEFATKIMPAAMASAQTMMMLGMPFSVRDYIVKMAKSAGIPWLHEVFFDPMFQQRAMLIQSMGPQFGASKGQPGPANTGGDGGNTAPIPGANLNELLQNGQPGRVMGGVANETTQVRQDQQAGAVADQQALKA